METIEQVNEDFNVKKPKKKGLIITGIVLTLAIFAFILVYFLVLTNPKFIFSKTIDKLFAVNSEQSEQYDSIKVDTKIKASADLKDLSYQAELAEIEKCTIKAGVQMDFKNKQEIVELGLEYDDEAVIDGKVIYNDGELYTYLENLFDKYIELDIDEESKEQIEKIFENGTSKKQAKNSEKIVEILRDELKAQIKEQGKFEKEKDIIDIGENEEKVTKSVLTISEKQLWKITINMLSNLAENEEFLECFEDETIEEDLKELAELMEKNKTDGKSNVKISLYTKGLLNKLVAIDVEIYVAEEKTTLTMSAIKEDEGVYSYSVSGKSSGINIDLIKGKVEIKKDKHRKKEQSGKVTITAEVMELGSAKLEIDCSVEVNQGIDKIDTSNSININELTDTDMQSIMTKLMERPLIGELLQDELSSSLNQNESTVVGPENNITTRQNEVKDTYYGYSVTYSVPAEFKYDSDYSQDYIKYYQADKGIDATLSLGSYTDKDYKEEIDWEYNYYLEDTEYYKNIALGELKTIKVGDREFNYQTISYEANSKYYEEIYQNAYIWTRLDDEHIFYIELEAVGTEITEDIIKGFLNISVTKLN